MDKGAGGGMNTARYVATIIGFKHQSSLPAPCSANNTYIVLGRYYVCTWYNQATPREAIES